MTHPILQAAAVTWISLRTIPQRRGSSGAAVFGIAGVVAVLVGTLSIAQGFRQAMTAAVAPENVVVLRGGVDSEMLSILGPEEVRVVEDTAGLARDARGALASAELYVVIDLPKRSSGTDANVPLRGVGPAAYGVRPEVQITAGRRFEPGRSEIIAGRGAAAEFAGLDLGSRVKVGRNEWTVVGIFSAGGGLAESEIWTDAVVLQDAYERDQSYQAVYARLDSAGQFDAFKDALTSDPRLNVRVVRQADYYAEQAEAVDRLVTVLGTLVAALMGMGALFGALNTMYTSVSARRREIATLRALGFGGGPVVASVLLESLVLALAGGAIGAGLACGLLDGYRASTLNWQSFSQVAFAFAVTPQLLLEGVAYAAGIGLIGGAFPAIRAARLPVAVALRDL
ncbi:MAG TPA: ABC transporter permease [Candidatus Paceibacterota bacterium]|nr:ABC transporter permease [Verrucomicrobiota bacterium]HRZ47567.1 ABC transporter permease [Candidatus Paceibacterota bacterium]